MVSVNQRQAAIRSPIVAYALKTVRILFGVMVVPSYVYLLFAGPTTDKVPVVQTILVAIVITVTFLLGWLINKKHPGHAIALLFRIMAYSTAICIIAVAVGLLTESLSTPYAASIHSIALVIGHILWRPVV
jgi:hypothetical protein